MKNYLGLLACIILVSCSGARTVAKSNYSIKEESKTTEVGIDTSKTEKVAVKEENVVKTNEVSETEEEVTTTTTIKPVDPTKPATAIDEKGNKTELNNSEIITTSKASKRNKNQKEDLHQAKSENTKQTEKKGVATTKAAETKKDNSGGSKDTWSLKISWWWLLLLLIPVAVYVYYKKFGWNLPAFIKKE